MERCYNTHIRSLTVDYDNSGSISIDVLSQYTDRTSRAAHACLEQYMTCMFIFVATSVIHFIMYKKSNSCFVRSLQSSEVSYTMSSLCIYDLLFTVHIQGRGCE